MNVFVCNVSHFCIFLYMTVMFWFPFLLCFVLQLLLCMHVCASMSLCLTTLENYIVKRSALQIHYYYYIYWLLSCPKKNWLLLQYFRSFWSERSMHCSDLARLKCIDITQLRTAAAPQKWENFAQVWTRKISRNDLSRVISAQKMRTC